MSDKQKAAAGEFCSRSFTKHPRWTDSLGVSRAFTNHPNYSVCKNLRQHHGDDLDACWHDLVAFVYELTAEIGSKPDRWYRIGKLDENRPFGPGNVKWVASGWASTRRARWARYFADEPRSREPGGPLLTESRTWSLRHKSGCESEWVDPIDCACCDAERQTLEEW